ALEAVRTRDLVVASDYRLHADSNPALHSLIASAIAAPLIAHGEVVGTLTAYARRPRVFTEETCRLVRLYTAQAAIAIANADLLAETRRLARDDDLTGVLNRRSLLERLDIEIAEAARHGDIFAVVLCDMDGLKAVNDTAGHLVGNEVLRSVARTMRQTARTEDLVARFGGDEFVILLPRKSRSRAVDGSRSLRGPVMTPVRPNHTESVATFWIGTNPGSKRFPFVLRIPIPGEGRIFLAAIESWPRSKDVFCYQLDAWPEGAEIIQEVPVEAAWRVGTGLHLTLRRPRGRRSIFVWTKDRAGKTLIFWRSQTSVRAARPGIRVPEARGLERPIEIVADVAERY